MLTNEQKQRLKKLMVATDTDLADEHFELYGWSAGSVKKEEAMISFVESIIVAAEEEVKTLGEAVDQLTEAVELYEKEISELRRAAGAAGAPEATKPATTQTDKPTGDKDAKS